MKGNCKFGRYPQTADSKTAPIEWLVMKETDGKALLVSRYALDAFPYFVEVERDGATWATSMLRSWLNEAFLNSAFTPEEQRAIHRTHIVTPQNPFWGTYGGDETEDKIFLLDIEEAKTLFDRESRQCSPTPYAQARGVYAADHNHSCWWWLRSPGDYLGNAAYVCLDGGVNTRGMDINYGTYAVRPAMWVVTTSKFFAI